MSGFLRRPTVGAVEVAIGGVVVTARVDQLGVHPCPAAIAEHPLRRTPQRSRRHALDLADEIDQFVVGALVGVRRGTLHEANPWGWIAA